MQLQRKPTKSETETLIYNIAKPLVFALFTTLSSSAFAADQNDADAGASSYSTSVLEGQRMVPSSSSRVGTLPSGF